MTTASTPNDGEAIERSDFPVLRTIIMPRFTPEQIACLEERRAAGRRQVFNERVGGAFTGPWPRHRG